MKNFSKDWTDEDQFILKSLIKQSDCDDDEYDDLDDLDEDTKMSLELNLKNLEKIREKIKNLQDLEIYLKEQIIHECKGNSCKIGKYRMKCYEVKGRVDYSKIDVLKELDLDQYRSQPTKSWRIS